MRSQRKRSTGRDATGKRPPPGPRALLACCVGFGPVVVRLTVSTSRDLTESSGAGEYECERDDS